MSNYVKATNFATKDTLPQGDSNKIVKGTEIDNEFNSIAGAISSKADIASPSFTGTPAAPTATFGTNTTQLATTAFVTAALQAVYPVGSIYINATSTSNPSTLIGFGTWAEFGVGRVLVGQNVSDALFDTLEKTGGSKDAVLVSHNHSASSSVSDPSHSHSTVDSTAYSFVGFGGTNGLSASGTNFGGPTYTNTGGAGTGISVSTSVGFSGSSATNANVQPYIVVKMWKRTA
jgi:hypothetical protein